MWVGVRETSIGRFFCLSTSLSLAVAWITHENFRYRRVYAMRNEKGTRRRCPAAKPLSKARRYELTSHKSPKGKCSNLLKTRQSRIPPPTRTKPCEAQNTPETPSASQQRAACSLCCTSPALACAIQALRLLSNPWLSVSVRWTES